MKKLVLFLVVLLMPFSVKAISASSYIVMDQDSKRVLEGSNVDKESLIASITKIMTCIVAIEYGNLENVVEVDDTILKSFGSGIYIQVGEKLTLDDLLYGLMLRSGNDAALAIAKAVAGDVSSFVFLMNEMADVIGMSNTKFVNPSGLEEADGSANISTVYDMALLTRYAMKNENYRRIVKTHDIVVKSSMKTYKWINNNKLLTMYEYCTGGKTGFTQKARRTLVTTASKDNMNLIVVTFNDGNDFSDHKDLYEKYFAIYHREKVLTTTKDYGNNAYVNEDFYMMVNDKDKVTKKVLIDKKDNYQNGEVIGSIEIYLNEKLLDVRNLYFKNDVVETNGFVSKLLNMIKFWEKI